MRCWGVGWWTGRANTASARGWERRVARLWWTGCELQRQAGGAHPSALSSSVAWDGRSEGLLAVTRVCLMSAFRKLRQSSSAPSHRRQSEECVLEAWRKPSVRIPFCAIKGSTDRTPNSEWFTCKVSTNYPLWQGAATRERKLVCKRNPYCIVSVAASSDVSDIR